MFSVCFELVPVEFKFKVSAGEPWWCVHMYLPALSGGTKHGEGMGWRTSLRGYCDIIRGYESMEQGEVDGWDNSRV